MNYEEFTQEVANEVKNILGEGYTTQVHEKDLANGLTIKGVGIRKGENKVGCCVYVSDTKKDYPAREVVTTAQGLVELYKSQNREEKELELEDFGDKLADWEFVKSRLTARLYHKGTYAEVFESAKDYGFDDLIIVPYIDFQFSGGTGSVKLTNELMERLDVRVAEVVNIAFNNMVDKLKMVDMADFMSENAPSCFVPAIPRDKMIIISLQDDNYGAIGAILAKATLREKFPNGYTIIPSSIHEVLAIANDGMANELKEIIGDVNKTCVNASEVLSNHPYFFD